VLKLEKQIIGERSLFWWYFNLNYLIPFSLSRYLWPTSLKFRDFKIVVGHCFMAIKCRRNGELQYFKIRNLRDKRDMNIHATTYSLSENSRKPWHPLLTTDEQNGESNATVMAQFKESPFLKWFLLERSSQRAEMMQWTEHNGNYTAVSFNSTTYWVVEAVRIIN